VSTAPVISHTEAKRLLRRAAFSEEQIEDLLRDLPDPIDIERDGNAFFERGISVDTLVDRLGGSP
jgi:hypothetical protein